MKKNKLKGISLIVLVITIIIMIIIAGTIILSLNNSNIIDMAIVAKNKSDVANAKEVAVLAKAEYDLMSKNEQGEEGSLRNYVEKKLLNVGFKLGEINDIIDGEGNLEKRTKKGGVIIPEGFYYVGGTKEEGIVISDNSLDESKGTSHEVAKRLKGNQFIWIPVEDFDEFKRQNFKTDETITFTKTPKTNGQYYEIEPTTNGTKEVDKMYASIEKYKGFYIARYEAGVAEGMGKPSSTTIADADGNKKPVSKQGVNVWNYIPWGGEPTSTSLYDGATGDDTVNGAVMVARSLYRESSNVGLVSTLMYAVQSDAIIRWFVNSGINVMDSREWGNHYNSTGAASQGCRQVQVTGYNAAWNMKNIYDLAGNVYEWTMEGHSPAYRIIRGGSYNVNGNGNGGHPLPTRSFPNYPSNSVLGTGFRIACYIK
ncbi:MAG: hypothetical protein PHR25_03715 [Clostridia bacterium]|nr:hypothetical protein [Clostridia bacterium]MDD4375869.1 hypothetical protein [Clostridia bacterium]